MSDSLKMPGSPEARSYLTTKNALIENFGAYAEGLDSKNWSLLRSCFADEVLIDYGSISAGSGEVDVPRKSDDWVKILRHNISGFDMTRHELCNFRAAINDESVSCRAYMRADHIILATPGEVNVSPQEVVTVVGEYTNVYKQVDGLWKICQSKLEVNWSQGDLGLFEQAALRAN